ncbi:MHS family citrate/tricarballylate:H+ symporter-like MFS transporter [Labrys wisconsinensis]|uniref:MHS family citrate/tricarballylate:H+ symporter-like MFS transporter n=2 Tax=Labrys wisconsinensis TaxID=425677 RepID=A0ABU0J928_9HYPH|nr:MFS transporter [Labrys wisconsinensis]MDQ0470778.1 MHS family citrate/tricarballylate:H+ symporter-like MFS transporter [Labrys wisconsinensis]
MASPGQSKVATVLRVTSGNFLEMFDFFLVGLFANQIAAAFFPAADETSSLLATFMAFGAAFLMRPIGALFLGAYIDRIGRRQGLIVTLGIMATGTVLIAFVPGYGTIGVLAPLLVLIGRLLQGFSAGVELGGVSVYLSEMATPGHKGFYVAWQSASQQVAIIVGALIGFALNKLFLPQTIADWAWRIPFFIGCLIVPLIFLIRRQLRETAAFEAQTRRPSLPEVAASLAENWRVVALGVALVLMTTISFYMITVYTPTFGKAVLKLSEADSLLVTLCVGASNFLWLPIMGALSDRIGRFPVLALFSALMLCTAYPALAELVSAPSFEGMLAVELWFSFLYGSYNGAMVVALTEVVPAHVRTSGFSLAYSLATALGGFTPAVSTWLIRETADKAAPGYWLMLAAALSLAATLILYRTGLGRRALAAG